MTNPPTPYYSHNGITIYHGDSRLIVPTLELPDLVLTDPPYGIGYKGNQISIRNRVGIGAVDMIGDSEAMDLRFVLELACDVVSFGANNYPDQLPHRGRWICWDKRVLERADRMIGSPFELAWRNVDHGSDVMIRIMHGGVVNADGHGPRLHPTQKPLRLMTRILSLYPKARRVLDPFMGSGTTLRACKDAGLEAVGIEIEERYCEVAANRLAQEVLFA